MSARANTTWAEAFVDELIRAGVRDIVVAPGSRSTPLLLAAGARPEPTLHTLVDERSAGFFALGVAKGGGGVVAVITTSGTAAANLFPAVIEAAHDGVPLVLLTADRPVLLRGTDANQTIDQSRLFGRYGAYFDAGTPEDDDGAVRRLRSLAARVLHAARGTPPGPVQVNFPFAKPLEPAPNRGDRPYDAGPPLTTLVDIAATPSERAVRETADQLAAAERALIIAGPAGPARPLGVAAIDLARKGGLPLVADPLSGARFAAGAPGVALSAYDAFLRAPQVSDALAPDLVLRLGPSPTSSAVGAFLERHRTAAQIVIDDGARWADGAGTASAYAAARPDRAAHALTEALPARAPSSWTRRWLEIDRCGRDVLAGRAASDPFEGSAVGTLAEALPPDSLLFIGNSLPVRDLDRYAGAREGALRVIGNRGASGIDGLVSTAAGVTVAAGSPCVAVIGDLSFLHDMGGLFIVRAQRIPLVLVVINNDGGGIFHTLPVRDFEPAFTRHLVVPHGLGLAHAAQMFDLAYELADSVVTLPDVVQRALARSEPALIEVRTDRASAARRRQEDLNAVAAATRTALVAGD